MILTRPDRARKAFAAEGVKTLDKFASTCHPFPVNNDAPSWDLLRRRLVGAQFSPHAVSALGQAIDQAERLFGRSWPRRQFERKRWWPDEFNLLTYHAAVLPRFLALTLRLDTAADEPTFDEVLRSLKHNSAVPQDLGLKRLYL